LPPVGRGSLGIRRAPVLRAFAFALAITIVIKQLPDAFGCRAAGTEPWRIVQFVVTQPSTWHLPTLAVAAAAGALVVVLRRWRQTQRPGGDGRRHRAGEGPDLHALGVADVGHRSTHIPTGIPDLPKSAWLQAGELFGLTVLIVAESWGSMRSLALAHGDDALDPNRELLVLGAVNVGAALVQGMPVGAGFSASSANAAAGARSRWAGAAAFVTVVLALLLALPALPLLPRPVLAIAVISALWHALSPRPLLAAWRLNRDRFLIVAASLAVLLFGVLNGLLLAIAVSVLVAVRRFSLPSFTNWGRLDGSHDFNTRRTPEVSPVFRLSSCARKAAAAMSACHA
jgi:MFS superfamily sulfate permease-like transporter